MRHSRGPILTEGLIMGGLQTHVKQIPFVSLTAAAEVDTGYDLPAGALVVDCLLDIDVGESSATAPLISVGILSSESGGDADGFLFGVSTASASGLGLACGSLSAASPTLGLLLKTDSSGSSSVSPSRHKVTADARSVSYTLDSPHTELKGRIILVYQKA
jgi:hypothetical protein